MPAFLANDDWRNIREFESILCETSRLTKISQNEEKVNGACGPVMRKSLHDSLSRATMLLINTEQQSSDKCMTHSTRSQENGDSFTETGKFAKREH